VPWFPVDDRFHSHPKAAAASLAAIGLWTVAGSWANEHTTDGDLPGHMIALLSRGATELADELVTVGLWRRTKTGYRFHQWQADGDGTPRNATRSEVNAVRQKKSLGGAIGAHRRWHTSRAVVDPDCLYCKGDSDRSTYGSTQEGSQAAANAPLPSPTHPTKAKPSSAPPTDDDADWAAFWAAYPRRDSKPTARKAWPKAIKTAGDPAIIVAGAKRYAGYCRGKDRRYVALPATWLNGERWLDQSTNGAQPTIDNDEGWWNA
jgi:hypothetical protein